MHPIKSRKHIAPPIAHAALLTSLALAASLPVHAQSAGGPADLDQRRPKNLDKVEVKGERVREYSGEVSSPKFTQPLVNTTQTVNVIGADLFNEQGATTLTDVLRNSPGVGTFYVGENGNTTTGDAIFMRGFDSSSSIFVDGARDLGSISRDVFNTQQVEVTKGPAGTDYGRSAPTGSVNLASKRAALSENTSLSLSLGTEQQHRLTADINRPLTDSAALRINLMAQDSNALGRDEVKSKRWGIAPSLGFGLDGATKVYLNLLHIQQNNTPDGGVPTIGLPGYTTPDPARPQIGSAPKVNSRNFYGTRADHDDVTADMATIIVEHAFNDKLRLTNTSRWGRTQQDYLLTAFMLRNGTAYIETPDINDRNTWVVKRSIPTFKDQTNTILTNQTNLSAAFGSGAAHHDLSMGLELTRETLQTRAISVLNGSAWPAANLYNPDPNVTGLTWAHNGARGHGRTNTAALYAFDTLSIGEQWKINAGIRFDRYTAKYDSTAPCGGRGPSCGALPAGTVLPNVNANDADTLFNWKLGVLFKPTAASSLYANYAISQQPPGGGSLELSTSTSSANNPNRDPQKAKTAEVGAKWNLHNNALLLTAALYDTRVSNELVRDVVDNQYYQIGEKRVRGIELSAAGQITENWAVSAGYTRMNTDIVTGATVTADGSDVLAYTPDSAFTAWTTYHITPKFTLGGGARYSGEMKRGSDGAVGTPTFVNSFWVFDAVASYDVSDRLSLRLNVNNLFDKAYVAGINKSGYRYTPGAPRYALLTATFRF